MLRRYDDPIEVRSSADGPQAFVWRGRLYRVLAVLDHWQERRPWWRDALDAEGGLAAVEPDRQVWRVEAGAGRAAGTGVYDLAAPAPGPGPAPSWVLLGSLD